MSYRLEIPHFTDTDGYTDRDREMFAAGWEYRNVAAFFRIPAGRKLAIRAENGNRVRMLAAQMKRSVLIEPGDAPGWLNLTIYDLPQTDEEER
jgi:hypothetical protein